MGFESPEMAAGASEPGLNFVGYTEPTGFPYAAVDRRQVTRSQFYDPSYTLPFDTSSEFSTRSNDFHRKIEFTERMESIVYLYCFGNKSSNTAGSPEVDEILDILSVLLSIGSKDPPVRVRV